jgi:hypothetical protein
MKCWDGSICLAAWSVYEACQRAGRCVQGPVERSPDDPPQPSQEELDDATLRRKGIKK